MAVYFAKAKGLNRVKIGYTSAKTPKNRIETLQTSCADDLEVVYFDEGADKETEKQFHRKFQNCHINREWFYYRPLISDFLGDCNLDLPTKRNPSKLTPGLQDMFDLAHYRLTERSMGWREPKIDGREYMLLISSLKYFTMEGEQELCEFLYGLKEDFGDLHKLTPYEVGWIEHKRERRQKETLKREQALVGRLYAH